MKKTNKLNTIIQFLEQLNKNNMFKTSIYTKNNIKIHYLFNNTSNFVFYKK